MGPHRDTNVNTALSADVKETLWLRILAAFKSSYSGKSLIYRSSLEASEYYLLHDLFDFKNNFEDGDEIPKKEILSKINKIVTQLQTAKDEN